MDFNMDYGLGKTWESVRPNDKMPAYDALKDPHVGRGTKSAIKKMLRTTKGKGQVTAEKAAKLAWLRDVNSVYGGVSRAQAKLSRTPPRGQPPPPQARREPPSQQGESKLPPVAPATPSSSVSRSGGSSSDGKSRKSSASGSSAATSKTPTLPDITAHRTAAVSKQAPGAPASEGSGTGGDQEASPTPAAPASDAGSDDSYAEDYEAESPKRDEPPAKQANEPQAPPGGDGGGEPAAVENGGGETGETPDAAVSDQPGSSPAGAGGGGVAEGAEAREEDGRSVESGGRGAGGNPAAAVSDRAGSSPGEDAGGEIEEVPEDAENGGGGASGNPDTAVSDRVAPEIDYHRWTTKLRAAIPPIYSAKGLNKAAPVAKNLWIGDTKGAKNIAHLTSNGIKSVINCAPTMCRTSRETYADTDIEYHEVQAEDAADYPLLEKHLEADVLPLIAGDDPVLIHCFQGVNRSATLLVACLMRAHGMPLIDAAATVHAARPVILQNNDGFIRQLIDMAHRLELLR
ncbi:Dual specificity protein phosphatase 1 [Diplonema papillatum]|nr:Dual specificity protein phosphatase 1 [Diplonema papillatum]|eukprot:gene22864-35042_t